MEERDCTNCKHFENFYRKFKNSFRRIMRGVCLNPTGSRREKKAALFCSVYEERDEEQERAAVVSTVTESLSKIEISMKHLEDLLKDIDNRATAEPTRPNQLNKTEPT